MSLRIPRSRAIIIGLASKHCPRFLCTILSSPPPPSSAFPPTQRSFLKHAFFAALTGATALTACSWNYSVDEIDESMKWVRESANYTKFQGFLYSAIMTVVAKAVELYLDVRKMIEENIRSYTEPFTDKLLPDLLPQYRDVLALVLDLDETLVADGWTLLDNIIENLDPKNCIRYGLGRRYAKYQNGKHFKDLSKLNRDPAKVLYFSGHALENCLQPENCVPVKAWHHHVKDDTALLDFIPFLEYVAYNNPTDVRPVLGSYQGCDIPTEFIRRFKECQRRKSFDILREW